MASEASSSYLLRRPTGIISLDIELAGGFPAGAPVVLCGPDGAGKDYLLWSTAAAVQEIYGEEFSMVVYLTEFKADKIFMKDLCGLQVGMSDDEIQEMQDSRLKAGLDLLSDERVAHYQHQVGDIMLIDGIAAEDAFDIILDFVSSCSCQIIAINSLGSLQTQAKENTESLKDFAQRASEAMLMSKFMPILAMTLNKSFEGERNETSIILVNQMRAKDASGGGGKRIKQEKDKYRPALESWSLKHGKAIELTLHKGPRIYDEATKTYLGRETRWEITKGKLGTYDGRKGNYNFFFDGGVDILEDLVNTAVTLGVIEQSGSWLKFDDPDEHEESWNVQGRHKARRLLKASKSLRARIREMCLKAANVTYRHI